MAYISSKDNRFYVALEPSYGQVPSSSSFSRIPAVKLAARQQRERVERKDKTGARTFAGYPAQGRRATTYELNTYMRDWADQTREPGYGPLFQACLGRPAAIANPLTISSASSNNNQVAFTAPHGLIPSQGVTYGADLRFVAAVVDDHTVQLNASFTTAAGSGATTGYTATYRPGNELPSVSILDSWSPQSAVQRLLYGAVVDQLQVQVNSDF